jgi:hypothetical protein
MVARAIHKHGSRADKPFVAVNCAAIPKGAGKRNVRPPQGAFTGAVSDRIGRFQQADKGTLFLDEVGDMPWRCRPRSCVPSGAGDRTGRRPRERKVDVRVIAATNKNLLEAVANKEFRRTLACLNVFPIPLPALRERVEDIAPWPGISPRALSATAGKRIAGFSAKRCRPWRRIAGRAISANCRTALSGRLSSQPGDRGYRPAGLLFVQAPRGRCDGDPQRRAGRSRTWMRRWPRSKSLHCRGLAGEQRRAGCGGGEIGISERSFWYR